MTLSTSYITESDTRRSQAHEAGKMAFRAGLPHHENPYLCHLSIHWSIGWIEAQRDWNEGRKIYVDGKAV